MAKQHSALENELKSLNSSSTMTVAVPDLVMMQSTGRMDEFLDIVSKNDPAKAARYIESARDNVTTTQVFEKIVDETVNVQVGEKLAAIRETGQNAIDSYSPMDIDRRVITDIFDNGKFSQLVTRDFGIGMTSAEGIPNLLVPLKSGKDTDATKTGEHGIGFFANADLGKLVKAHTVDSLHRGAMTALLYEDGEQWMAAIDSRPTGKFQIEPGIGHGTEVSVLIPKGEISEDIVRKALYKYMGLVPQDKAEILFKGVNGRPINTLRKDYATGIPVNVEINGISKPLTLGVSKRVLLGIHDDKYYFRDMNLDKLVITQGGLFVKYDTTDFDSGTVHNKLISKLQSKGVDFWLELPDNVTLTKGRNNVIADHSAPILEATYSAFESVFLDVILNDEDIQQSKNAAVMESIASLFDVSYNRKIRKSLSDRVKPGTKMVFNAARYGSNSLHWLKNRGHGISRIFSNAFSDMPENLGELIDSWNAVDKKKLTQDIGHGMVKYGALAAVAGTAGLGLYELYEWAGPLPFIGVAGLASVAYLGNKAHHMMTHLSATKEELSQIVEGLGSGFRYVGRRLAAVPGALADLAKDSYHNVTDSFHSLLISLGYYDTPEQKREKKREYQRKKISQRYLSSLHDQDFFKKISQKKIIPAEVYMSDFWDADDKYTEVNTLQEYVTLFRAGQIDMSVNEFKNMRKDDFVAQSKKKVMLSIDEVVDLFLRGQVQFVGSEDDEYKSRIKKNVYRIDNSNPLVQKLEAKFQSLDLRIKEKYDVKIFQDHVKDLKEGGLDILKTLYLLTPIGLAHVLFFPGIIGGADGPFSDMTLRKTYVNAKDKIVDMHKKGEIAPLAKKIAFKTVKGAGIAIIFLPYVAYNVSKGAYNAAAPVIGEAAKRLFSAKTYHDLGESVSESYEDHKRRSKEKKEYKKEMKKHRDPFFTRLKTEFMAAYRNSLLFDTFGYGIKDEQDFNNLSREKLEHIVKFTGAGGVYLDYMKIFQDIDKIVSAALDEKRFDVVMSKFAQHRNDDDSVAAHKKDLIVLNLETLYSTYHDPLGVTELSYMQDDDRHAGQLNALSDERRHADKAIFAFRTLDALLHARAHSLIHEFDADAHYDDELYVQKSGLRRKVAQYIIDNDIDPAEIIEKNMTDNPGTFYEIDPLQLGRFVNMTRRKLQDESKTHEYTDMILDERRRKFEKARTATSAAPNITS